MKRAAFYLVAAVASLQMLIVAISVGTCLIKSKPGSPPSCDPNGELGSLTGAIVTQVFALYAAEK
jgi:hypothetical protein